MNLFDILILGIVEGITEFLPISSTAHLDFTRLFLNIFPTDFFKSFEITIQLGAILAVVILYFKKIFSSFIYLRNITIAFIPTGIIGFLLYSIIKKYLINNTFLAALMLILGGIIILIFERRNLKSDNSKTEKTEIKDLSIKELLILGLAQALAVVPGVSRSGAVIIAGRSIYLSKTLITEFSFLLAIPTMFAATIYDLLKSGFTFSSTEWNNLLIGFLISFIVALGVVKWLLHYIRNHSFEIFGWYRIIFGLIILLIIIF